MQKDTKRSLALKILIDIFLTQKALCLRWRDSKHHFDTVGDIDHKTKR